MGVKSVQRDSKPRSKIKIGYAFLCVGVVDVVEDDADAERSN